MMRSRLGPYGLRNAMLTGLFILGVALAGLGEMEVVTHTVGAETTVLITAGAGASTAAAKMANDAAKENQQPGVTAGAYQSRVSAGAQQMYMGSAPPPRALSTPQQPNQGWDERTT